MSKENPAHSTSVAFSALAAELQPAMAFIRRWWMLAVAMTFLTSTMTLAIVCARGVEYQVSAALFYKLGQELAPPPTMGKDPLVITRRAEDVNDEIEILTSPGLIHHVVQELGEDFFRTPPPTTSWGKMKQSIKQAMLLVTGRIEESLIQLGLRRRLTMLEKIELGIGKKLKVELVRNSDVISITLNTPASEAGVVIVQKLLDAYQARHLIVHRETAVKDLLADQTQALRQQLAESTAKMLEFQLSEDLWSAQEQQRLLLDNRKSLQMQLAETTGELGRVKSYVTSLGSSVEQLPAVIELSNSQQMNPAVSSLEDRLASLNQNQAVVKTAFRPGSRELRDQEGQIQALQSTRDDRQELIPFSTTQGINPIRQDLVKEHALKSAELLGLQDRLAIQKEQLAELDRNLHRLGSAIANYQHLEREHRLLEQKYALYSENFEKADISSVMNLAKLSNMELISPPTASKEPVSPRLTLAAAAGIVSGLLMAFALGILFELRAASRCRST